MNKAIRNCDIYDFLERRLDGGPGLYAYAAAIRPTLLPHASDKQLGIALRKWREGEALKANALAVTTGVSQSYISEIENGKRRLNEDIADRIARGLRISFEDFEQQLSRLIPSAKAPVKVEAEMVPFSVNTPGLGNPVPGAESLARWYISTLTRQEAALLVNRFMAEYQDGDESGLAKAKAILHILSES